MPIPTKAVTYEGPKPGTHQAVISNVYDLGRQRSVGQYGEKVVPQIAVMFELKETMKSGQYAGKRFVQTKTYTNIISDKSNLKRDLTILIGEAAASAPGYDLENLIGVNCFVTLAQNEKGYVNIVGMTSVPDDMPLMTPELARDHKPEWIAKKQAEQVIEEQLPEAAQKAADSFSDCDFYEGDLEQERMIADILTWRKANTLTQSKLIATTKMQTGKVIVKDEDIATLTKDELVKVYNIVNPEC